MRRICFVVALLVAWAAMVGRVRAQTLGDTVREHVDEQLEQKPPPEKKKRKKKKKKRRKPKKRSERRAPPPRRATPASAPAAGEPVPADDDEDADEEPRGKQLPLRVIGENLELDPQIGFGYRGWRPQQYPTVAVKTGTYFTGRLELQAKLFKFLKINRGFYETNSLRAPKRKGAVIAQRTGDVAPKVTVLFGAIGVPLELHWEPLISYESRAYEVTARPKQDVRVIPHSASEDDDLTMFPLTRERLSITSRVETLIAGVRYKPNASYNGLVGDRTKGWIPPLYLGVGLVSYGKPYQVTVGDATLDELVFDARFRGIGLAFGFDLPQVPDHFFLSFGTQAGIGEVKLTRNFSLNEALPDDWLIGYSQGTATVGYLLPLMRTKPTPIVGFSVNGSWATFFYFKTQRAEGETLDAPPLNWDVFWGASVFFVLPL